MTRARLACRSIDADPRRTIGPDRPAFMIAPEPRRYHCPANTSPLGLLLENASYMLTNGTPRRSRDSDTPEIG